MEQESKISFWKKFKISIFGLENYQTLAVQRVGKTIGYLSILMLIFAFLLTTAITYRFHQSLTQVKQYISENIEVLNFENGNLTIQGKTQKPIVIEEEQILNGKIIIDTSASEQQVQSYTEDIKSYQNGIVISKDKVIFKNGMMSIPTTISLVDIANQYHIVKVDKQMLLNFLSGSSLIGIYALFFIVMAIYLFIIYLATALLDAILYAILGHITALFSGLRLRYGAVYNIAIHSLTLPIVLNLIYMIVNILTGYTISYFSIMYTAITSIYVITSILMIKSDIIKKQIELSKIMEEQEKVRQELERKEQEKKEAEEKERLRKEDEKKRKEEKQKEKEEKKKDSPEPQANIRVDS